METFLLNLLKTSLLGALVIAALLALKPFWRERYRAKTRCWLWLALALFLLFPVDFSVKNAPVQAAPPKDYTLFVGKDKTTIQSTDDLFGDMAERSGQTPTEVRDAIIERPVTDPAQKTTRYIPVTTLLFYGYLAGAAAFLLYQGVSYALFRRTVRRWKRDVSRADYAFLLYDTAHELGVKEPQMLVCEAITTPAVTGFFRPTLLLPHERYDLNDLRYILRHELCHLKRRDMLLKFVLLLANAMHWFDPMVYLMLRQADEDIELACDSAATDGLERAERAAYSRTLLAAVQSNVRALPATTCFGSTVERLKRRITNVLGAQKKRGLGVVALVLALTLTAGCAVGWGQRVQANNDPFANKAYTVDTVYYEAPAFTDGLTDWELPTFLTATNPAGEKYVTMCNDRGYAFIYGPMEEYEPEKQSFYALFGSTESASPVDDLIRNNEAAWTGYCEEARDGQPYQAYLLEQKDGTVYLGLSADYAEDGSERFCWVFRLSEQKTVIYPSMDDYAAARAEQLEKGSMAYYVSENGNYSSQEVKDTVADVRVTQLELGDSLEGLSPDGTVLELWYFEYEMKPTNEAGAEIAPIGGQEVTDDGYLNEHWTHYLTVLHYIDGDETGYQIIGTYTGNDGLWYNGCSYSEEETHYLHDFYIDYAGLDLPRYQIGSLYHFTDGYGNDLTSGGRIQSGDGWYFYLPDTGTWKASLDEPLWESSYGTESTIVVKEFSTEVSDAVDYFDRGGWAVEEVDGQNVYTKTSGAQHARVRLYSRTGGGHYEMQTFWYDGQSTQENQWGWSAAHQVEGERDLLEQMAKTFQTTEALPAKEESAGTASASMGFDALDAALDALGDMNVTADPLGHAVMVPNATAKWDDRNGTNIAYRAEIAKQFRQYSWKEASNVSQFGEEVLSVQCGRWNFYLYSNYKNVLSFFNQESDPKGFPYAFEITNTGAESAVWDAFYKWYEEAVAADSGKQTVTTSATNALSRAAITKTAESYVDLDGYLWYISGGKLCRWREGSAVETICTLPIDSLSDSPVRATLSIMVSRVALRYHIGGAAMGTYVTELYNSDGKQYVKIDGYESIAFDNHGNIVKTLQFPPEQNNLYISYDSGKTWTSIGDADYFYGSVTEEGDIVNYTRADLTIRDGYVYTTAVYDVHHQKTSDPLVTHAVRISIKTGAQEILD